MCHQELKASGAEGRDCEAVVLACAVPAWPPRACTGVRSDGPQETGHGVGLGLPSLTALPGSSQQTPEDALGVLVSTRTGSREGSGAPPLCGVHAPSVWPGH